MSGKPGKELLTRKTVYTNETWGNKEVDISTDPNERVVAVEETPSNGGKTILERDPQGRIVAVDGPDVERGANRLSIAYNHRDQRTRISGWWGTEQWTYEMMFREGWTWHKSSIVSAGPLWGPVFSRLAT